MQATDSKQAATLPPPPAGAAGWELLVYAHTHWDREWYQPYERFRLQLVGAIDAILDTLETDDRFTTFVLDGQTIVLDDYLELRPERRDELAGLIKQGRLEVGPWYILPDEFLVSGESLVRNLLEGRRGAERFGQVMSVGYLPDPFGHIAQMPQILHGFGIGTAIFSRGMSDQFAQLGNEFVWTAPDGESSVVALVQTSPYTNGYCNAELFAQVHDPNDARVYEAADTLANHLASSARTPVLLFAAGCDHETVNPYLPDIVEALDERYQNGQAAICGLTSVAREVHEYVDSRASDGNPLGGYTGELRGSRHAPILAGIFSTRIALKQDNVLLQTWLERYVEPLMALAAWAGYQRDVQPFVRHAWRLALQNQPHDSIGGCSVDLVHEEMPVRTMRALELCQGLLEELATALDADGEALVFNPQPYACGGLAWDGHEPVWIPAMPALSLAPLAKVTAEAGGDQAAGPRVVNDHTIENACLRVALVDGRINLMGQGPQGPCEILDALQFVDVGDAGDEYDFGAVPKDRPITARLVGHETRLAGDGVAELVLEHQLLLPDQLLPSRKARSNDGIEHHLTTVLRVAGDQPWVDCATSWENFALDHRLRVQIALGAEADLSTADGQFAVLERPVALPVPQAPWKQDPIPAQHCESFASITALADERAPAATHGAAVFTRGLHEYEVTAGTRGSVLELTLLRAVGWLSRDDVPGRPGHAGPGLETPGAQCLGQVEVEYAIMPFVGSWQSAGLVQLARRYSAPPLIVQPVHQQISEMSGQLARRRDLRARRDGLDLERLNAHGLAVVGAELSALKLADDGSGDLIVRAFNPRREPATLELRTAPGCVVGRAGLDEEPIGDQGLEAADGAPVRVELAPSGICTLRVRPRG